MGVGFHCRGLHFDAEDTEKVEGEYEEEVSDLDMIQTSFVVSSEDNKSRMLGEPVERPLANERIGDALQSASREHGISSQSITSVLSGPAATNRSVHSSNLDMDFGKM